MIDAKLLPKSLRKFAHLIADVSDERAGGDGYWVYLVNGYRWDGETHCVHEDTITDCARAMRCVAPCTVPGCCTPEGLS